MRTKKTETLELLNKFFQEPTMKMDDDMAIVVVNAYGREEYAEKFQDVKKTSPKVYHYIECLYKGMQLEKKESRRKRKNAVSQSEKATIGFVANTMKGSVENFFADSHVSFVPDKSNPLTATKRRAETDGYFEIEMGEKTQKYAILLDGWYHKTKEMDDVIRSMIFNDNGMKVVRVREVGLPTISNQTCDSININYPLHSEEGRKETCEKLVDYFKKEGFPVEFKEQLYHAVMENKDSAYNDTFQGAAFFASIPEDKMKALKHLESQFRAIDHKRAPITRSELKGELKAMRLSRNVKAAIEEFMPASYMVLRKYW